MAYKRDKDRPHIPKLRLHVTLTCAFNIKSYKRYTARGDFLKEPHIVRQLSSDGTCSVVAQFALYIM